MRGGGCKNTFYELMMVSHAHIKMVRAQKEYLNLHGLVSYFLFKKISICSSYIWTQNSLTTGGVYLLYKHVGVIH